MIPQNIHGQRVLVIGTPAGAREDAIVYGLLKSPLVNNVYVLNGNAGTARRDSKRCSNLAGNPKDEQYVLNVIKQFQIDLTVIGPEAPLIAGMADFLRENGCSVVGPGKKGARLEGSKRFAKEIMLAHGIPTASARFFDNYLDLLRWINTLTDAEFPIVLKADGEALGKGVKVCWTRAEALEFASELMEKKLFGDAASTVVVEEYLKGPEASLMVAWDESGYKVFIPAQDHKPVGNGNTGPNTGGMGSYAPTLDTSWVPVAIQTIVEPMRAVLRQLGIVYQGILYIGLKLTPEGPKVVEFNCRLGDPETQSLVVLMKFDLFRLFWAIASNKLAEFGELEWHPGYSVCVVMASGGYPGPYKKGYRVRLPSQLPEDVEVFHAGTTVDEEGEIVTSGGRVLGVTGTGPTPEEAADAAYHGVLLCGFQDEFHRWDIPVLGR